MKKKCASILLIFIYSQLSFAQSDSFILAQKNSLVFSFSNSFINAENSLRSESRFPEFSFGFRITEKNGDYKQFSVNNIWFKETIKDGLAIKEYQTGIQYINNAKLWDITPKLTFLLGGLSGLEYYKLEASSFTSQSFPSSIRDISLHLIALTEIRYALNEHWILLLNFPLAGLEFRSSKETDQNPALNMNQQEMSGFNLDFSGFDEIKLGAGYVF